MADTLNGQILSDRLHAHVVIGRRDGTAHAGHLMSATVRPTREIIISENPEHLQKQIDSESGPAS